MLKDRQKSILGAAVREHIRTARPIASRELVENFRLGLSPATVRSEMLELDELGYLLQPHTSAGRVPTDRGYRFFVDNLISQLVLNDKEEKLLRNVFSIKEEDEFVKEFSKIISQISGAFTAAGMFGEEVFYETGFSKIAEEPEFAEFENFRSFGRLVDMLDEEIRRVFGEKSDEMIFIGEENPLKEARECAMVISSWKHPLGFEGFFTIIGPKRTNYPKHKAVIKALKKLANESLAEHAIAATGRTTK